MIHSGPQWLQSVRGGRETQQAIPPVLIVAVTGPGRVLVSAGTITIAELTNGTLVSRGTDVFQATWLEDFFAGIGATQLAARAEQGEQATEPSAKVSERFGPVLACHFLRRVLATVRGAQHGGTLIIAPEHHADQVLGDGRRIRLKYPFIDEEPRRRIATLTAGIMNELARVHQGSAAGQLVGWNEYENSDARQLIDLDEALFEAAHLVADLTRVDGAVVMTTGFDLLGFGGEIAGDLPASPARHTRARPRGSGARMGTD